MTFKLYVFKKTDNKHKNMGVLFIWREFNSDT